MTQNRGGLLDSSPRFFDSMESQRHSKHIMIRFLGALGAAAIALFSVSCNCTSEPTAPPLRDLPQFQEMPAAVEYSK